jgi:hypothetical protein
MDDCAACGFVQRRKASGNPSLAHSKIFLLANCLNASIKTDTPSVREKAVTMVCGWFRFISFSVVRFKI